MTQSSEPASADIDLFCPQCQYNLRGLEANGPAGRCPECGQHYELAKLSQSRVPWIQRREIGRARAWWQTCWMALRRPAEIAASLNAPQSYPEARRFWLVNVALLSLPAVVACFVFPYVVTADAGIVPGTGMGGGGYGWSDWIPANLVVPWMAAMIYPAIFAACCVLAIALATGLPSYLFQLLPLPRKRQNRAAALSLYASGIIFPSFVLWLALMALAFVIWLAAVSQIREAMFLLPGSLPILLLLTWWLGVWGLYRKMDSAGFVRSAIVVILIPLTTLLSLLLALWLIPWCIGLIRIIWYSVQA